MSEAWVLWAWRIFSVLGIGTVLFWMSKTIKVMKGTVDTQKDTISAQSAKMDGMESLLKAMEAVLKSTDEQSMLARLKAHKEFVEEEKGALVRRMAVLEEENAKIPQVTEAALQSVFERLREMSIYLIDFATNSLPYVPTNRREEFVNGENVDRLPTVLKTALLQIARHAPDLQPTVGGFGGTGSGTFIPARPELPSEFTF
jgi:hypothetical protein